MRRLKYAAIWLLDRLDAWTGHRWHPGLCEWIEMHPWWGEDDKPRPGAR